MFIWFVSKIKNIGLMFMGLLFCLFFLTDNPAFSAARWIYTLPADLDKFLDKKSFAFPAEEWWQFRVMKGIKADPLVVGDTIFIGCKDGVLYAIDILNGSERWRYTSGAPIHIAPFIEEGFIYCGNQKGTSFALECGSGRPAWSREISSSGFTGVVAEKERVCYTARDGNIYCLNSRSGNLLTVISLPDQIEGQPVLEDGILYIGCDDFSFYAYDTAPPGKRIWDFPCDGAIRSPAVIEGDYIFFGSDDRHLYCLEKTSGKCKWKARAGGAIRCRPVIKDSLIFFNSLDNRLYAVKKKSGDQELKQYFNYRIYTSPALLENMIIVTPSCSKIEIFDLKKKKSLESHTVVGTLTTSPLLSHNTLFVCTSDLDQGILYALKKASEQTIGFIAAPRSNETLKGECEIKGWALDKIGIDHVEIWIDNAYIGTADYGQERSDISRSYPTYFGNEKPAFEFTWDTASFPDGEREMAVRAVNMAGSFREIGNRTVVVENIPFVSGDREPPFYLDYIEPTDTVPEKGEESMTDKGPVVKEGESGEDVQADGKEPGGGASSEEDQKEKKESPAKMPDKVE